MTVLRNLSARSRLPRAARPVEYPVSDGKPMAETDWHWDDMVDVAHMLKARYRDAPDACVASNMFVYYVEGDPKKVFAPDVYVVFGAPKRKRRMYKLWEEGVPPAVVFEMTSRKTRREDIGSTQDVCARLGVDEYFLHDPEHDYLRPPLQGFRLDRASGAYHPMAPDTGGGLVSERLGLRLWDDGGVLALADRTTQERLLRPSELAELRRALTRDERMAQRRAGRERAARLAAEARALDERAAREVAEADLARLRAEVERLRGAGGG